MKLSVVFNRYQIGQETSMKGSSFTFDCVHLLQQKCHKICGGSKTDSPDWIKNKKATINPFDTLQQLH